MKLKLFIAFAALLLINSCSKDESVAGKYEKGIFIVNQGKFSGGSGSITYYNEDSIELDIYKKENGDELGPIAQSLFFEGSYGYITINNDNKVIVVNAESFKKNAVIDGLALPRYCTSTSNTIFISEWGANGFSGKVKCYNKSNTLIKEIITEGAPEKMLAKDGKLYVTMSNGFKQDSLLKIYNLSDFSLIKSISLSTGPNSIVSDTKGNIWVLCEGYFDFLTGKIINGSLYKLTNDAVVAKYNFEGNGQADLCLGKNNLTLMYHDFNKIYEFDMEKQISTSYETQIPLSSIYGLAYSKNDNVVYFTDAGDFNSQGTLYQLDLASLKYKSFKTGIVPGQITIK